MEELGYFLAALAVLVGTAFAAIGILGLVRLPDVYARMHAVGKVATFGVVLLTIAAVLTLPFGWSKALVLIALLILGGPVTSHAIGSAAYRLGIPIKGVRRDDLARHRKGETEL